jgi:hypothetical protein
MEQARHSCFGVLDRGRPNPQADDNERGSEVAYSITFPAHVIYFRG